MKMKSDEDDSDNNVHGEGRVRQKTQPMKPFEFTTKAQRL